MTRTGLATLISIAGLAGTVAAAQIAPAASRPDTRRPAATPTSGKPLDIYVVDTEGGKAALYVLPSGETVLIDSGNPGGRDVGRLMAAVDAAGVKKIDYLISTHYHVDHVGGLADLVTRIPVGTFIDHGPNVEERQQVANFADTYAAIYAKGKHLVVKPGDKLPLAGVDWRIVTSAGEVLKTPLTGAGQANAACAEFKPKEITTDLDNAQSVGSVITFGQFKMIDLADLLWNKEFELMCPKNPIGAVDLYMVSHHGIDQSGSPAFVHAIRPRVAVMQNGTRKGGTQQTFQTLQSSPGFEDLWQLHWSYNGLIENNTAGAFIANIDDMTTIAGILTAPPRGGGAGRQGVAAAPGGGAPAAGAGAQPVANTQPPIAGAPVQAPAAGQPTATPAPSAAAIPATPQQGPGGGRGGGQPAQAHTPAYWIKISAQANGTFTITNSRNGFSKTYVKR